MAEDVPPHDEIANEPPEIDEEDPPHSAAAFLEDPELQNEEDDPDDAPHVLDPLPELADRAPAAPRFGTMYNNDRLITIVHTNGIHQLSVTFCKCHNAARLDKQLLTLGYYPASRRRPSTAFTFESLNDVLLTNKECKAAVFSYMSKLCRTTDNVFPDAVPVRTSRLYWASS